MHIEPMNFLAALLAQAPSSGAAPASPLAVPPEQDYRSYVFAAYGSVVLLLLIYTLWLTAQSKSAEKKLDHLQERLDQAAKK